MVSNQSKKNLLDFLIDFSGDLGRRLSNLAGEERGCATLHLDFFESFQGIALKGKGFPSLDVSGEQSLVSAIKKIAAKKKTARLEDFKND